MKRIALRTGEIVTERELRSDENLFDGPVPGMGDKIWVACRGRAFEAEVVWRPVGADPNEGEEPPLPIRLKVAEFSPSGSRCPIHLQFVRH